MIPIIGQNLSKSRLLSGIALGVLAAAGVARADQIDVGDPDWAVRWDNTIKYSNAFRVGKYDPAIGGNLQPLNSNTNDGDQNFRKGLISDRADILSEFDAVYQEHTGFRLSAAAWYDTAYNQATTNHDVTSSNNAFEGANQFPQGTRILHGKDVEILDALVFHTFELPGEQALTVRVGRFSQLYGETLFMGANGIAAAQAPIDVVKALSVPNSQFKEIMLPVGQASFNWELGHGVLLGGYYQFEYRPDRLPGVGSYFSDADIFGAGAETLWPPGQYAGAVPGVFFAHGKDLTPSSQGQGGTELRWKATKNWEFGLYFANYHEKDPAAAYLVESGAVPVTFADGVSAIRIGDFRNAYNQNVQTYGASFATAVGDTNVSGEVSLRHNQSLATADSAGGNGDVVFANASSDNLSATRYLRGETLHANISAISLLNENSIWDGASIVGELGFNHLIDILNKGDKATVIGPNGVVYTDSTMSLNPTSTHSAVAARAVFEPSFFQVIPNLDLTTPIGLGYGLYGRSALGSHIGNFNAQNVGDVSIGAKGKYNEVWNISLTYTSYFGPKGQPTAGGAERYISYTQDLHDRDFIAFSVSRTF